MKEVSDNLLQLNHREKTLFIISLNLELILECCTHVLHFEAGKFIDNYSPNPDGENKIKACFLSDAGS